MVIESIRGLGSTPIVQSTVNKAKSTGNFMFGTWTDDFATDFAKTFKQEVGIVDKVKNGKEVVQKGTGFFERFGKVKNNFTKTSFYNDPINTIENGYKNAKVTSKAKSAARAAEKAAKAARGEKGFFGKIFSKVGDVLNPIIKPVANFVSKVPVLNTVCSKIGQLGKMCKLPLIGAVLMTVGEIPKVFEAFAEGGIGAGLKQITRSAVDLGISCGAFAAGSAAGAAIGQILIPIPGVGAIIGGLVGGMIASWAAEKATKPVVDGIMGKSHSEKKEEATKQAATQSMFTNKHQSPYGSSFNFTGTTGSTPTIAQQVPPMADPFMSNPEYNAFAQSGVLDNQFLQYVN